MGVYNQQYLDWQWKRIQISKFENCLKISVFVFLLNSPNFRPQCDLLVARSSIEVESSFSRTSSSIETFLNLPLPMSRLTIISDSASLFVCFPCSGLLFLRLTWWGIATLLIVYNTRYSSGQCLNISLQAYQKKDNRSIYYIFISRFTLVGYSLSPFEYSKYPKRGDGSRAYPFRVLGETMNNQQA